MYVVRVRNGLRVARRVVERARAVYDNVDPFEMPDTRFERVYNIII